MVTIFSDIIITTEVIWTLILTSFIAFSFILGVIISLSIKYPQRLRGDLSSFSAGIFFSTASFILIDESIEIGSYTTMALGFIAGALSFSITRKFLKKQLPILTESLQDIDKQNVPKKSTLLNQNIHNNRVKKIKAIIDKKSYKEKSTKTSTDTSSSNTVIIGKLMDSIPKALFIGVIVALDLIGLLAAVISLFLGNLTATMEGARRMKEEGKVPMVIIKRWILVATVVAISGPMGYFLARPLPNEYLSILIGFAAGDLIAFIVEDLIPEAYKKVKWHTGLSASFGFLVGLTIFHIM